MEEAERNVRAELEREKSPEEIKDIEDWKALLWPSEDAQDKAIASERLAAIQLLTLRRLAKCINLALLAKTQYEAASHLVEPFFILQRLRESMSARWTHMTLFKTRADDAALALLDPWLLESKLYREKQHQKEAGLCSLEVACQLAAEDERLESAGGTPKKN